MSRVFTFPTVHIRTATGDMFEVPAEPTEVPGLFVAPDVWLNHLANLTPERPARLWDATWQLVHGPSGSALPYRGPTPEHCRELARALAAVRPNWSGLPADLDRWPAGLLRKITQVGGAWECRRHRLKQPAFFWPLDEGATT